MQACAERLAHAYMQGFSVVLACDQSIEGVLAATGISYLAHVPEKQVRLSPAQALQPQLGELVVEVPMVSDDAVVSFARRVMHGFAQKTTASCRRKRSGSCPADCSGGCLARLMYATASDDPGMPQVVYRYLRLGFSIGPRIRELLTEPRVVAFNELARSVAGECEHARQFVRFSHQSDGSFAASYSTKANVIPLVANHFATRMITERFCLVDPQHKMAAFHAAGQRTCSIAQLDGTLASYLAAGTGLADDEAYVRAMWQRFYQGTALPGRGKEQRGYDLRTHWMPQRLWQGLTELAPLQAVGPAPARYDGEALPPPSARPQIQAAGHALASQGSDAAPALTPERTAALRHPGA